MDRKLRRLGVLIPIVFLANSFVSAQTASYLKHDTPEKGKVVSDSLHSTYHLPKMSVVNEQNDFFKITGPLWYETWWVWVLFGISTVLVIYQLIRYRARSIQKANERLELLIKERTASMHAAMLELQQSKNEMTDQVHMLSRLLASIAHDVQSPLNYITFTSAMIEKMVQLGELEKVSELGFVISDLSNRMSAMLKELLNYIKIQVYGNKMQFEELSLSEVVDSKIGIFQSVIKNNQSQIYNEVPANMIVVSDYQLLSIIIHNLIDNAAKYTRKGKISISAQIHTDGVAELTISNTGNNRLPEEMMAFINGDLTLQDEKVADKMTSGIGLVIIKEIAEMIGVEIKVDQNDQTNFHLFFDE